MTSVELETLPEAPLFDPAYKANPYPYYREWTRLPPFWALVGGQRAVVAARYRDVAAIYLDHRNFSSVKPPSPDMARFDFFNGLKDLTHNDPPDHTRLRRTINAAFAPGAVARMRRDIKTRIDAIFDRLVEQGARFDVMSELAHPLSLQVMLGVLLDVPEADYAIFNRMSQAMGMLGDVAEGEGKPREYLDAWAACETYCHRVIADQKIRPTDDVIGTIVAAAKAGTLSESEMLVMIINVFVGGLSTIATLIGNSFVQILAHSGEYVALRQDPALAAGAIDEVLRVDSPGLFNYKFAACDLDLVGLRVRAGTTIYLIHQATGFDASVFEHPERFDIRRKPRNHLSFGYGVHFCLGAHVARLVGELVLEAMVTRLPRLRIDPEHSVRYGGWEQERAPIAVQVEPVPQ